MKIAVLHHNDADGFGAAFAAHTALSERHELLFKEVQYGEPVPYEELHAFAPDQVYILDFSYKASELSEFMTHFPVVVIDHHKSAAEELKGFPDIAVCAFHEVDTDGIQTPIFSGVRVYQENSGCMLAWLFFCPNEDAPEILHYVQDRDLWKFDLEHSKEINAFIATMPQTFEAWADFYMPLAYDAGKAIIAFRDKQIESRVKGVDFVVMGQDPAGVTQFASLLWAYGANPYECNLLQAGRQDLTGHQIVPIVNASENISELGEALCLAYPDAPFSISYADRPGGLRSYSLRSRNGFDVSEVAKAFGGGGHPGAAGFTLPAPLKI